LLGFADKLGGEIKKGRGSDCRCQASVRSDIEAVEPHCPTESSAASQFLDCRTPGR
jgi:hypothetical protein